MDNCIVPIIMVTLIFGLAVISAGWAGWQEDQAQGAVKRWSQSNGYRLIQAERRPGQEPIGFDPDENQIAYRIRDYDRNGRLRSGWARAGGVSHGMLSDKIEVRWD